LGCTWRFLHRRQSHTRLSHRTVITSSTAPGERAGENTANTMQRTGGASMAPFVCGRRGTTAALRPWHPDAHPEPALGSTTRTQEPISSILGSLTGRRTTTASTGAPISHSRQRDRSSTTRRPGGDCFGDPHHARPTMNLIPNRTSLAKCLLVALACAFGIYWLLSNPAGNPTEGQRRFRPMPSLAKGAPWDILRENAPRTQSHAADRRALSRTFSLLRHRPERMPRRLQDKVLTTLGASASDLRLRDAQYAPTVAGGVWTVYGQHIACIVQAPSGNVGCDPLNTATRRGIVLGVGVHQGTAARLPRDFLVVGLAPDWAKAVRVRIGKRKVRTIPIRKNVYSLRAPELVVVERLER
jgi:hypothetical protein